MHVSCAIGSRMWMRYCNILVQELKLTMLNTNVKSSYFSLAVLFHHCRKDFAVEAPSLLLAFVNTRAYRSLHKAFVEVDWQKCSSIHSDNLVDVTSHFFEQKGAASSPGRHSELLLFSREIWDSRIWGNILTNLKQTHQVLQTCNKTCLPEQPSDRQNAYSLSGEKSVKIRPWLAGHSCLLATIWQAP